LVLCEDKSLRGTLQPASDGVLRGKIMSPTRSRFSVPLLILIKSATLACHVVSGSPPWGRSYKDSSRLPYLHSRDSGAAKGSFKSSTIRSPFRILHTAWVTHILLRTSPGPPGTLRGQR